jgi:hypothetical protein
LRPDAGWWSVQELPAVSVRGLARAMTLAMTMPMAMQRAQAQAQRAGGWRPRRVHPPGLRVLAWGLAKAAAG